MALVDHLQTFHRLMIRGYSDGDAPTVLREEALPFTPAGESAAVDGAASGSAVYARLMMRPFIPEPGVNDLPRRDPLFYPDPDLPDTLRMAVQNPEDPSEWTVYAAPGFGDWFRNELDLYIREFRGL